MNNKIYIIADLHGSWKPVRDWLYRHPGILLSDGIAPARNNILICLGDFGGNFYLNDRDDQFKKRLGKYDLTYFIIRGNHEQRPSIMFTENPNGWHIEQYFGNNVYVENEYPYIKYAMDVPTIYNIHGYETLILGGAYSVDKYYRLQNGWSWFEQEQMRPEEMQIAREIAEGGKIDLVLSHTCPICYEPTDLFLSNIDQSMVDKTMERFLGEIEYKLDYRAWCWGHYHAYREYPRLEDDRRKIMLFQEVIELEDLMTTKGMIKKL